jgi:S1-C subfamily serine protease
MNDLADPLAALSHNLAERVERSAPFIVAVQGGGRPQSGIHWRPGIIVTAEEVLERDEELSLTLPDGKQVPASLAGRDPTTDVAVLRFQPDGLATAVHGSAAELRVGQLVLAIGRVESGIVAHHGIVAHAGGAWQSQRGGTIDRLIRLDLGLGPSVEGGAVIDMSGQVLGMAVRGPRQRALAIPGSTIDRSVDLLLRKGHVTRGYLGASLQPVRHAGQGATGVLVSGLDPEGPAAKAGLMVGDIITAWNGTALDRVRVLMRALGTESVGRSVTLSLSRGGVAHSLDVTIGERPLT